MPMTYRNLKQQLKSTAWLAAAVLVTVLGTGCSDGTDVDITGAEETIALLDLLPASTVGIIRYDGNRGTEADVTALAAQSPSDGRHAPSNLITHLAGGPGATEGANQLILAQLQRDQVAFALLANFDEDRLDDLIADRASGTAKTYKGVALLQFPGNGVIAARLNAETLVSGSEASVQQIIDSNVSGDEPQSPGLARDSLELLEPGRQWSFVYGLAGLYADVPVPGSGNSSLNRATMIRGAFDLDGDVLRGTASITTGNATLYTERLLGLLPEGSPDIIEAEDDTVLIDLSGLSVSRDIPRLIRSMFFGMNTVDYAEAVSEDGNAPWLNFDVGSDPNSVFINFEFKDADSRAAFEAEHLPAGFRLAPLRILEGEERRYFLVLNLYQSSGGLVEGARAEWSVFIEDPEAGVPRFLVVQAAAENFTADSVNLLVPGEPVDHRLEPDAISSYIGVEDPLDSEETLYFSSRINWPQPPAKQVRFDREFVVANDYIFWGNAVADRGLYNSSVHNRPGVLIDADQITIEDQSRWRDFVSPEPVHALVYLNPLDIVISPWWNLDKQYLDVTEEYRGELVSFKNGFYPGLMLGNAAGALNGTRPALTATALGTAVPTSYFHFVITDPAALLASMGLADDFTPATIALYDDAPADYYLTLSVYALDGDPCGLRADWSTYVAGEQGQATTLQLDSLSEEPCVDPVAFLDLPANIEHTQDSQRLHTRINTPMLAFHASVTLDLASEAIPGQDWVAAGDEVCAANRICDYSYYDGATLLSPLLRVDFEGVTIDTISTPWSGYLDTTNVEATVRPTVALRAINPWRNVNPFGS